RERRHHGAPGTGTDRTSRRTRAVFDRDALEEGEEGEDGVEALRDAVRVRGRRGRPRERRVGPPPGRVERGEPSTIPFSTLYACREPSVAPVLACPRSLLQHGPRSARSE